MTMHAADVRSAWQQGWEVAEMRGRRDRLTQAMWDTTYPRTASSRYDHALRLMMRVIALMALTLIARIVLIRWWPIRPVISR